MRGGARGTEARAERSQRTREIGRPDADGHATTEYRKISSCGSCSRSACLVHTRKHVTCPANPTRGSTSSTSRFTRHNDNPRPQQQHAHGSGTRQHSNAHTTQRRPQTSPAGHLSHRLCHTPHTASIRAQTWKPVGSRALFILSPRHLLWTLGSLGYCVVFSPLAQ